MKVNGAKETWGLPLKFYSNSKNRGLKGREPRVAYGLILRMSQLESERG